MTPHDPLSDPSPFSEPWQAQAFAMVVSLHEEGLFEWDEWAQTLSGELQRPGVAEDGSDYYVCWLRALEKLLDEKSITDDGSIERVAAAWSRAANATPHGEPIVLENDPEHPSV
ncbi:MAG: nitrile hydratase accessory protein [Pseudomonadota bacterium]